MQELDASYWDARYRTGETGWDAGGPTTPLKAYIDQLGPKDLRILIPGAGRAYEAEHLHRSGFTQVHVIDLTDAPYADLLARCPDFPRAHLHVGDFFAHEGRYDRILEQTFFCALDPSLRPRYVRKMHELLAPGGRLVGVLFDDALNTDRPPFGGHADEYRSLFGARFTDLVLEPCTNSIPPRAGRELWLRATRTPEAYTPIDCSLYDRYEAWATRRTPLVIEHVDDAGTLHRTHARITDLRVEGPGKAEWMHLSEGGPVRLDHIRTVRPVGSEG